MSISPNRILANHVNLVRDAVLAVTAQRASTDFRLLDQQRAGGGRVSLAGAYTGAEDTEIEVEILAGDGTALRASAAAVRGVGNGALTVTEIRPAAVVETLTFALVDAGDPARAAELEFYGAQLAARAVGAAGNALGVTITRNLVATPTSYATLVGVDSGMTEFDGPEWDWGQPAAAGADIPASAPRIQFEGFPTIHRAWKRWRDGRFIYLIDPPPPWAIPADTRVLSIAGDYDVEISDGVETESYPGLVTVHDLLAAIQARSALVEVRTPIALDSAPGGMAVTDIPLRTDAHTLPPRASTAARTPLLRVDAVDADAATENLTVTHQGGDVWSVTGGVSGSLPNARTGVAWAGLGPVDFTIPAIVLDPTAAPRIQGKYTPAGGREEDAALPSVCLAPLKLGVKAVDQTVTFTYRARPATDCRCDTASPLRVSDACLGLNDGGDMALDPEYQTRLTALYAWRADFHDGGEAHDYDLHEVPQDVAVVDACTRVFAEALGEIHTSASALGVWDAAFEDLQGDLADYFGPSTPPTGGIAPVIGEECEYRAGNYYYNSHTGHQYGLVDITRDGEPIGDEIVTFLVDPWTCSHLDDEAAGFLTDGGSGVVNKSHAGHEYALRFRDLGEFDNTMTPGGGGDDFPLGTDPEAYAGRYRARMDLARAEAGIVPKSDASSGTAGDGCWRDIPGTTHWWVDERGDYLPAFTNHPYVSARLGSGIDAPAGHAYSTKEFGFGILCNCEHRLVEGDTITITISGAANASAYAEGDTFTVPVLAAGAAPFSGGSDGDGVHTWSVRGSVSGALPDYSWDPDVPAIYDDPASPIEAMLAPGGIPFEVGDQIAIAIEGGALRWRRDGGSWTDADLYGAAPDLGDGLSLSPISGTAPSFLAGDRWLYQAVATHGASRLRQPRIGRAYAWEGAATTIDLDLGAVSPVEAVLIGLHTLPASAEILVEGGDAAADEWSVSPAWRAGAVLAVPPAATTARYLRVTVTGAGDGAAIGWLWAGSGWQPSVSPSEATRVRQYGLIRGGGLNPSALYRGRGEGGNWTWNLDQGGVLDADTLGGLIDLVDHVASQGLEPVCLIPDLRHPAPTLALLDADDLTLVDALHWHAGAEQLVSVTLPFRAVLA